MSEPRGLAHRNGICLDARTAQTLGARSDDIMHQHARPQELALQVLSLSADDARRVRESIADWEPCQESKLDCSGWIKT